METRFLAAGLLCVSMLGTHGCTTVANPELATDSDTSSESAETSSGDGDGDPGDGDGDGDGDPATGELIPLWDMPKDTCDVWMQDCSEGEKCVPYASQGSQFDDYKCVPVVGSGAAGDPCTYAGKSEATDDCGGDLYCWDVEDVDGMQIGVCTPFCGGGADDPICSPGSACATFDAALVPLCLATCDPLLQDCGAGTACFWNTNDAIFACIFTTSDIPLGEPCGFVNDCAAGLFCAGAEVMPDCNGAACCAAFCSLSDPACAQPGTECTSFFEQGMATPGYEDVGICIIPGA